MIAAIARNPLRSIFVPTVEAQAEVEDDLEALGCPGRDLTRCPSAWMKAGAA